MLSFFSIRWKWDSPTPLTAGECAPPPLVPGGTHSLLGEGMGVPNSDVGTYTVVLYVCMYFMNIVHKLFAKYI